MKRSFSQTFLTLPGSRTQLSTLHSAYRSPQGWLEAPLQTKPKERWDHGWDAWAQGGEKCTEESCGQGAEGNERCGGTLKLFFYSQCSSEPVCAESFTAQNLQSRDWTLFPDLKIVFHWHVYWVLALPAGKSQAACFLAQTPVHLSTCTWALPSQSVSLTINRC